MTPMIFLISMAFLATLGVLVAGGVSMVKGGQFDLAHAHTLMEARVVLHALTLVLLLIAVFAW